MTSPNNTALQAIPPATFTYVGQAAAAGYIKGGVLIGDLVNDSSTTPAGSADNIPTVTLSTGVPISAILELQSTTGSLCIPRMTTTQRNAMITIVNGMMIYNTSTTTFQFYQNGSWVSLSAGAGGVVGPGGGSTDTAIATWNGAGGNALNNSTVLLDGSGNITAVNSLANAVGTAASPSYTFTARTNTGMYSSAANTLDFATDGTRQLEVGGAIVAVNYATVKGSTTGNPVVIGATGSDAAVNIQLFPKGTTTGQVEFPLGAVATPAITFLGELDTGLYSSAAATIDFASTGGRNLQVQDSGGTTVNYATIKGSATGNAVIIGATGSDAAVNLQLLPKGATTGQVVHPLGAVATPSITFLGETDVGLYSSAAHTLDVAINSTHAVTITGTALQVLTGNLIAGVSGTAGTVTSFPATSARGSLVLAAVANTGNTLTTISNAAMGQASVISIPDPGASTGNFLVTGSALVSGNFPQNSGTAGLVVDSGVTVASVSAAVTQLGQLQQISVTLNTAAVVAAYATPQVLIAAVAGKVAIIHSANVYTASTGNTAFATGVAPIIQYGTTVHGAGTIAVGTGLVTGDITAATSQIRTIGPAASTTYTGITDTAVCFSCTTAYTAGTGTSVTFTLVYELITATV